MKPNKQAQSEAPSLDELDKIFAPLIDSPSLALTNVYWEEAKAKINRLIVEAELRGFDKAFDSHAYDELREYRQELSNNLSKEDESR